MNIRHALRVFLLFLCLCCLGSPVFAASDVQSLRFWTAPDHTRVVFGMSAPVTHKVFTLSKPPRLVIDLDAARVVNQFPSVPADHALLKQVRSAKRGKTGLRVVLDLQDNVKPKSFLLKPNGAYGHRLVIDLYPNDKVANRGSGASLPAVKTIKSVPTTFEQRDVVIAIDAGHGGEDPGAIGRKGTREKHVVLSIAKKLAAKINRKPGMRAVLIRSGDYYIGLRDRMAKARKARADLFVSIHADAFKDSRAKGSSVYVLSNHGASSEAALWLAKRENSSDLMGGVKLVDKDHVLAHVLLDLSQNATKEASVAAAGKVLKHLRKVGHVHKPKVQHAGFMVLKSPDVPSILVETAFISNPYEENNLRSHRHQERVANAILLGIDEYFDNNPLPGTRMAASKHVIRSGDTLSEIASRYDVSVRTLKKLNALKSNQIRVGQVLQIPG